jgi:molecular chaperone IbpA
MFSLLQDALNLETVETYPPYDIEKTGEDAYRITLAVAGFAPDELSVVAEHNALTVTGRKSDGNGAQYLYQGIAGRPFERHFDLADYVKVTGASLENGLLAIDLVRLLPEAVKPRRIEIGATGSGPQTLGAQTLGAPAPDTQTPDTKTIEHQVA